MRKWNGILTLLILVLFLLHGILGSFQMMGVGAVAVKKMAWATLGLAAFHAFIGLKLTWDTLKAQKAAGAAYIRENILFWTRRISGFAVMLLLGLHLLAFGHHVNGVIRLRWFTVGKLTTQILLLAAIGVHILSNVRPLLIAFGCKGFRRWMGDILFVLSVLILFMALAFVVYFLRWNVF